MVVSFLFCLFWFCFCCVCLFAFLLNVPLESLFKNSHCTQSTFVYYCSNHSVVLVQLFVMQQYCDINQENEKASVAYGKAPGGAGCPAPLEPMVYTMVEQISTLWPVEEPTVKQWDLTS